MVLLSKLKSSFVILTVALVSMFGIIQLGSPVPVSASSDKEFLNTSQSLPNGFLDGCKYNASTDGGKKASPVTCVGDILELTLVLGVMVMLVRIASVQFGIMADPNSAGKAGPVVQTRKITEDGLIGILLIAAPVLFLNLFNTATTTIIGFDVDTSSATSSSGSSSEETPGGLDLSSTSARNIYNTVHSNYIASENNFTEDSNTYLSSLRNNVSECKNRCLGSCAFFEEVKDNNVSSYKVLNNEIGLTSDFVNVCKNINEEE